MAEKPPRPPRITPEGLRAIKEAISTIEAGSSFASNATFELNGEIYEFINVPNSNEDGTSNGQPAEFFPPERGLWRIFIWEDLPANLKRLLLLHELVEIQFKKAGLENTAHGAAREYEKEFRERLSPEERDLLKALLKKPL